MRGASQYVGAPNIQNQILLASGARTATGTGEAVSGLGEYSSIVFQLNLTAAATDAGDTLDVYVQTTVDGTNWVDIVHFTQMLGNGGAKRFFGKINRGAAMTMFENGTALGAAAIRDIFGDQYRVRWAITDASTQNASFTFSVTANAF